MIRFLPIGLLSLFLTMSSSAYAVPTLQLSTGSNTVTIMDGGSGDWNPDVGAVTYIGSLGNWFLNISSGITKPILGSASSPMMDVVSGNISGGGGTLTLTFSDTDFYSLSGLALNMLIGGTTSGTVAYKTYWCEDTSPLCTDNLIGDSGLFASGAFSDWEQTISFLPGGFFTLTQQLVIDHSAWGASSFNAEFKVPEPSVLVLFGVGLLCLVILERRRTKNQTGL